MLHVTPDALRAFLEPLAVGRLWGVGAVARQRLEARGIRTIGELGRAPEALLREALGSWGPRAARLARGQDEREVDPYHEPRSYGEENTFAADVRDRAQLERAIREHAEAVARRLRRDGLRARGVELKLKLGRPLGGGRYPLLTRSLTLAQPTDDGSELAAAARALLARAAPQEPVRLVGVSASRLESESGQLELFGAFDPRRARRAQLNRALDAIRDRFGSAALHRAAGERPERAGLSLQIKRGEPDADGGAGKPLRARSEAKPSGGAGKPLRARSEAKPSGGTDPA
jgi:DNA polymerase-4